MDLKGKRIAVVLSGGGAKGAYQIGMFRALEEAGLEKDKLILAGTSIGAMNSLMYAIRGADGCREMIHAMNDVPDADAFLKKVYPDELLASNTVPVTVCAYCVDRERTEYFPLNGLPPQDQRALTRASASLPDLWPPVEYRGHFYLDGGKVPPQCSAQAGPADKIPVCAVRDKAFDILIISYLKPEDALDLGRTAPGTVVLESRPSVPLEDAPGTGTRDYSGPRLDKNERMGYEETKRILTEG